MFHIYELVGVAYANGNGVEHREVASARITAGQAERMLMVFAEDGCKYSAISFDDKNQYGEGSQSTCL
jgi:hypothetical protein